MTTQKRRTLISFIPLGALGLLLLVHDQCIEPFKTGYFKNDQSIAYPYKPSTIPSMYVHAIGLVVPFSLIFLHHFLTTKPVLKASKSRFGFLIKALPTIVGYLFGVAISQLLTDLCKYNVGRLRPHFLDLCQPEITNLSLVDDSIQYVSADNYNCYNSNSKVTNNCKTCGWDEAKRTHRIREAYLSFPSGHTSYSFQTAVFIILYLQAKFSNHHMMKDTLIIPMVQLLIFVSAIYTGITRIQDYKHHPTDVIAGALIGAFAQIANALGITKIFEDDKDNVESEGEVVKMKTVKKDVIQKDMSTNETTLA